jgi:hypothetical protein
MISNLGYEEGGKRRVAMTDVRAALDRSLAVSFNPLVTANTEEVEIERLKIFLEDIRHAAQVFSTLTARKLVPLGNKIMIDGSELCTKFLKAVSVADQKLRSVEDLQRNTNEKREDHSPEFWKEHFNSIEGALSDLHVATSSILYKRSCLIECELNAA